jgi:hypothetical protein
MNRKSHLDVLREIQAVGYLREIDIAEKLNLPRLTIESNWTNSMVFALPTGTAIIIELCISANRTRYVERFGALQLAGENWDVDWWVEDSSPRYILYHGHDYPRDAVLNHHVKKHGRIVPGYPKEGFLLGRCQKSVPLNLRDCELPAKLTIYDGRQNWEHEFSMRFDHAFCWMPKHRKPSLLGVNESLGECPSSDHANPEVAGTNGHDPKPAKPSGGAPPVSARK